MFMAPGTDSNRTPLGEPSSISSSSLARVKAEQPEAWERLVNLYGPVVYQWCRQYGAAQDDAPDLVQEVFIAVAQHVGRFRRDRPGDSFGAWLRAIVHNKVRNHFAVRQGRVAAEGGTDAQERLQQVPDLPDPSTVSRAEQAHGFVLPASLEHVRAEFESRTWEAFQRTVIDRQPPAEVAAALGMTIQAVYKAKSRVLCRLREDLDGLIG